MSSGAPGDVAVVGTGALAHAVTQGLFISRCGGVVESAIDAAWLGRQFEARTSVLVVDDFYEVAALAQLLDQVADKKLDSLVLAGDSPYAFRQTRNGERLFAYLAELGIDRNRVEVVNLVNMVARANQGADRKALQEKARLLTQVALDKVRDARPLAAVEISPRKAVALVGGTAGALLVAQHLLDHGFRVDLLHANGDLGAGVAHLPALRPTLSAVTRHPRLRLFPEARAVDFCGYPGDYTLRVVSGDVEQALLVGAVVLTGSEQPAALRELQSVFHVDIGEQGTIETLDDTTSRSRTQEPGVFVVNPLSGQSGDLAALTQAADAAAAQVMSLLDRNEILHRVSVSAVDEALCGGCGVCVKTCMFHAVSLRDGVSVIDPRRCRGCGNCVTACPAAARDLVVCPTEHLANAVRILAGYQYARPGHKILLLACDGCGYRNLDRAAEAGETWPVGVLPLWVVCGGQIDTQLIMQALVRGFDGVALAVCGEGCCHNLIGNVDLERRVNLLRKLLAVRGVDPERLRVISTCARRGEADCARSLGEFDRALGPVGREGDPVASAQQPGVPADRGRGR